jgi:hypothetical protein
MHCDCYADGKPIPAEFDAQTDFIAEVEDGLFRVGQVYDTTPAKTLQCRFCGSKVFNVGQGCHFTAIRCVNCKWELCIHDG